jgi:hypothetical protein
MSTVSLTQETSGEVLPFYENDNYQFIKGVTSTITQGTYVKLPTQEFIFNDFSAIDEVITLIKPNTYGYVNNNTIEDLEFTYEV